ncbi:MAG: leucyl aminopeptidase family protein [Myxococcota bacterium]
MRFFLARGSKATVQINSLSKKNLTQLSEEDDDRRKTWIESSGFRAKPGELLLVPTPEGRLGEVLLGRSETSGPLYRYAGLPSKLPKGRYGIADELKPPEATLAALGWALGCYEFDRYRKPRKEPSALVFPPGADRGTVSSLAEAVYLVRDLINTPASDMGPSDLERVVRAVAEPFAAKVHSVVGDGLLSENWPAVHAVGRASADSPRVVDLVWGASTAPKVTLVGKGVCFDTGGLDLKNAGGMLLMKKDMGGAAHVLGLAYAIMSSKLPVRLRVLIPLVENSVAGNAMRPLDVIKTRKGLTVEVGNTDAEGRLILSDALAEADSEKPEVIIDFATLTGAARVALGTELPALFCNQDAVASELLDAASAVYDPMWRMPLHAPYRRLLESKVADTSNVSSGRYGGAIVAALFLQKFVSKRTPWVHIDMMAWNTEGRAGRPVGGEAMGMRAVFEWLLKRFPPKSSKRTTTTRRTKSKS